MNDVDIPEKRCPKCGESFPATPEFFHRRSHNKSGLRAECKPCGLARAKAYTSRPEIRERRQVYDRDHYQVYYGHHENRERRSNRMAAYYMRQEVHEHISAYHKAYLSHPESRARIYAHNQTRRARKRSVPGIHTAQQIREQYQRQKGKCYYCREKVAWGEHHKDHVIPLSREGATNDISNIAITCATCNRRKHNKLPHEWPEGGRLF